MSKTDHSTAYVTPAEARATRELHTRQRHARTMFARVKRDPSSLADFEAWKAAEAEVEAVWGARKAIVGDVE